MKPEPTDDPRQPADALEGSLKALVHHPSENVQRRVASDPGLTEDLALAMLERRDLSRFALEDMSRNGAVMKSRLVLNALVCHPRTPRHVSLPIARHLYTFELMKIALSPAVPADIKMAAEEAIVARLETVTLGERLTLARQSSSRVAAALLMDPEGRIVDAALENPRMTEAWIVRTLQKEEAPQVFVEIVCRHQKWSLRQEIRVALLRNGKTPLARTLSFAQALPTAVLRDVLRHARIQAHVKVYLMKELETREAGGRDKA